MRYKENWKNNQVIRVVRNIPEMNNLISDYSKHRYEVKQISYSESFGNWAVAILFEKYPSVL